VRHSFPLQTLPLNESTAGYWPRTGLIAGIGLVKREWRIRVQENFCAVAPGCLRLPNGRPHESSHLEPAAKFDARTRTIGRSRRARLFQLCSLAGVTRSAARRSGSALRLCVPDSSRRRYRPLRRTRTRRKWRQARPGSATRRSRK